MKRRDLDGRNVNTTTFFAASGKEMKACMYEMFGNVLISLSLSFLTGVIHMASQNFPPNVLGRHDRITEPALRNRPGFLRVILFLI